MSIHAECAQILLEIELELRGAELWEFDEPDEAALRSAQPFCVDTLSFEQWLQFVFIRRMAALIESGAALPSACTIAPMAEERFRGKGLPNEAAIIKLTKQIDRLLSSQ